MRAFRLRETGLAPDLTEEPLPEPGPGEIRLRIAACALNFADLLMIQGRYQERPPLPLTLGMEVAGIVDALGEGVSGPATGTRVAAFGSCGGLAEFGCWPAGRCLPLPDSVSFRDAAAFQIAYGTGHLALDHRARLQPGERLLVTGAAGGVGLAAVEIGRRMGAHVIATARGEERLAVARAAGAHEAIDSETEDLKGVLKALGGIDVTYDTVGGAGFDAALRASRPEGRLLAIGFAGGDVPQVPANLLLVKNLSVIGLYWGGYMTFAPQVLIRSLETLLGWLADGSLRPHVSHELPLERAAEGLELLRTRQATGKVVITP
ncbi:NADPH:quinone oxidoreductase family protein [Cereibacter sphaeroides]|uniref:NADPH:quinone oxidoreductase family protein n=1 Tax=Cereibacter sphaeroides TaxID=1063 RepID=UPI000066415B|nr:Alcohol dehydrogenase, zinc-binding domain protein [Cereibacter sphaeroides ATCC 17029]